MKHGSKVSKAIRFNVVLHERLMGHVGKRGYNFNRIVEEACDQWLTRSDVALKPDSEMGNEFD